ncbi:virulence-associated E family protein [Bradyrhizobium sp. 6(2017)]|uniref:virulence-associated E family protein n=1 Tax=Bradyrhizobium sp. 6(2017) TaxID=1197460 RepID=UPI0013E1EA3F|nr:virulence-associated E family protein [Bradyrhizobium sp. 6(2017)]QIG92157.1 virulence-associated E family protein [Bradyrhizobium sp. 6(2017)]
MSNVVSLPAAPDWTKELQRYSSGTPHASLANASMMLREAPELRFMLAYDEFAGRTMLVSAPPWQFDPQSFRPRPWSAHDDLLATEYIQRAGIAIKPATTAQAVELVARDRVGHPVREYLESIDWDGKHRLRTMLTTYLGAADDPYVANVGSSMMIGAVARVLNPGCKHDHVPIWEGPQGIGKSRALKTLFGDFFCDEIGDLGSKDSAMQLVGVWGFEIAELDAYSRAEVGRVKAWVSRTTDRFRPPYGTRVLEMPRSCCFIGTTNNDTYLKDDSGNRRFWPVKVNRVDLAGLERDRDQLWAEAYRLHKGGAPWWFIKREVVEQAQREQRDRLIDDPWWDVIVGYVETRTSVSIAEVLADAVCIERSRWGQIEQNRVARCLKAHGWCRVQVRTGGKQSWRYKRAAE